MKTVSAPIDSVKPYPGNPRKNDDAVALVARSIEAFGFRQPIVVDEDNVVIAGHTRLKAARLLGMDEIPVHVARGLSDDQVRAYRLADNRSHDLSEWDANLLNIEVEELNESGFDISLTGFDGLDVMAEFGDKDPYMDNNHAGSLASSFIFPPFNVLRANSAEWQERKRAWHGMGLVGESGRKAGLMFAGGGAAASMPNSHSTSVFDPVLCELMYRWFCPAEGSVIDPFAGGSTRGVVAAALSLKYTGIDLSDEQVSENKKQAGNIKGAFCDVWRDPEWIVGDSRELDTFIDGRDFDFVFSCPPYGSLEKYSDDPGDISNMTFDEFGKAYSEIVKTTLAHLKNNRFAVFVVGDYRHGKWLARFHHFTVDAFESGGCRLHNDAVMLTAVGSAAIRARGFFEKTRLLCRVYQNVLVFCKGDPKIATQSLGDVSSYEDALANYTNGSEDAEDC